jgi:hypothetical protein
MIITPPVFSQGLRGWITFSGNSSETLEDGETISETSGFIQNNNFNYLKFITPKLSYQLNLRTRYSDETTDAGGRETKTYFRDIQPSIDVSLRNPMYSLSTGYQRDERWSTARITDESRDTTENYYSRFNISPKSLPSLSLQFNKQNAFDHLPEKRTDDSATRYSATSSYDLPSRDIKLSYSATYTHDKNETPFQEPSKVERDSFNGNLRFGHSWRLWDNRTNIMVDYQGNYNRDETQISVTETGDVLFRRTPFGGLYAQGTTLQPDVDVLDTVGWSGLVDEDFNTGLAINVGTEEFHNIGIWVSSEKPVDRLYIYVNEDVSTDTNLTNKNNWEVYWSNFNQPATWTEISINGVLLTGFDIQEKIYRYEIMFSEPQNASFFKAVTLETVNALGVTDVLVTEIEAYGIDTVPETGELSDESEVLTQRLNFSASVVPLRKLTFSLTYSINDTEQDFDSFTDALSGVFEKIFSKSTEDENDNSTSFTTRTYGATATWLTYKLLTTTLSFQKNDSFDNKGNTDSTTDVYLLSFYSSPLPTLDVNFALLRTETQKFDEKESTGDTIVLNTNAKLYRNITMTSDISYSQSENFPTEIDPDNMGESDSFTISGVIDAALRKNLFANLNYNFQWNSTEGISTSSQEGTTNISYRPGRFMNITGFFSISSSEGDTSTSEGFALNWVPFPTIKTNISYQHTNTEPGSTKDDRLTSFVSWEIKRFMTVDLTYSYNRLEEETTSENHSITGTLNCRF